MLLQSPGTSRLHWLIWVVSTGMVPLLYVEPVLQCGLAEACACARGGGLRASQTCMTWCVLAMKPSCTHFCCLVFDKLNHKANPSLWDKEIGDHFLGVYCKRREKAFVIFLSSIDHGRNQFIKISSA